GRSPSRKEPGMIPKSPEWSLSSWNDPQEPGLVPETPGWIIPPHDPWKVSKQERTWNDPQDQTLPHGPGMEPNPSLHPEMEPNPSPHPEMDPNPSPHPEMEPNPSPHPEMDPLPLLPFPGWDGAVSLGNVMH
uniref:Uncharacterized protein n=1 Tax=Zonotrichia albicollis TaxID=44394 RepID=A0A8D2QA71_ZONAL